MRRLALGVVSLAFLTACQPGVAPLSDEDIAALDALGDASTQATLAGDCLAEVLWVEDAILMPQDAPMIEGRAAIRANCEVDETPPPQDFTVTRLGLDGYGDLAVDYGTWSQTFVSEDATEPVTISGKYVTVSRKQADGSWRYAKVIWNSDAPLPEAEPEET